MNTRREGVSPERLAEAGVWIARLHSEERDRATVAGVRQWLQTDPLNAQAFELCTEVWEESANLRRVIPFATEAPAPRKKRYSLSFAVAMGAAVAAVAAVVGVFFLYRLPDVSTAVGEQRSLTLNDGTRVFLNTGTHVVVKYDKSVRRVELEAGEALFQVAKRPDWPFIVRAGSQQVRALGTSFVVRRDAQQMAVTLVEGKVTVSSVSGGDEQPLPRLLPEHGNRTDRSDTAGGTAKIYTLSAGQRLIFAAGKPAQLDAPSLEKTMAWRRGQVFLDDTPLASAVAEMNRYSSTKLVIERPETESVLINGLFQAGDSASFATAVAQAYSLQVIRRDAELILAGTPSPGPR
jgi:transmembrane sensor